MNYGEKLLYGLRKVWRFYFPNFGNNLSCLDRLLKTQRAELQRHRFNAEVSIRNTASAVLGSPTEDNFIIMYWKYVLNIFSSFSDKPCNVGDTPRIYPRVTSLSHMDLRHEMETPELVVACDQSNKSMRKLKLAQ